MLTIGKYHTLKIARDMPQGMYLEDEDGEEVLLPRDYCKIEWRLGEMVKVIVYVDAEDRYVATTETPFITLGGFAYLKVNQVNQVGAFCDWGTTKELFIPFRNQNEPLEEGKKYVVHMYRDDLSDRLVGTTKIKKYLKAEADGTIYKGQEVHVLVYGKSELGYKVIINQEFEGLIYLNEVSKEIKTGEALKGYVKPLREDGKIDISLKPFGFLNIEPNANILMELLEENNGHLPFTDKSDPEAIRAKFKMSKKLFKKALGSLYRQKLITLKDDGFYKV